MSFTARKHSTNQLSCPALNCPTQRQTRAGLTLVEILIALTMTLVVLGTMITAFRFASEEMQTGRALIELTNRSRNVEEFLRTDLANVTIEPRVYTGSTEPNGYFELIEGPVRDSTPQTINAADSYLGDCDDVLAFTARANDGVLFRGRQKNVVVNTPAVMTDMTLANPTIIESSLAEIVWFSIVNDNELGPIAPQILAPANNNQRLDYDDSVRIYRRALLIRPGLGQVGDELSAVEVNNFIRNNDISVRVVPGAQTTPFLTFDVFANNLQDLAVRGNRFGRNTFDAFPNGLTFANVQNRIASDQVNNANYTDFATPWQPSPPLLTDVAAFDMRVYSPNAQVNTASNIVVEPGDVGFNLATAVPIGAFVDLGYAPAAGLTEWFSGNSATKDYPAFVGNVWDSWTPLYEFDGLDQNDLTPSVIDEGRNGMNDGGTSVIDDPGESETVPPYVEPIRAIEVTVRLVEKNTKRVRQISVVNSFVPE